MCQVSKIGSISTECVLLKHIETYLNMFKHMFQPADTKGIRGIELQTTSLEHIEIANTDEP